MEQMMKIKTKLILGSALLVLIPSLIVGSLIGFSSLNTASEALKYRVEQQLTAVRDSTRQSISDYFSTINNQVLTLSANPMTIEAMKSMAQAFKHYKREAGITNFDTEKQQLMLYYKNEFNKKYQQLNNGKQADIDTIINQLDKDSIALQQAYINNNPNPLGEKEKLDTVNDNTQYSQLHKKYHPFFREFLNRFGYYDIFLVDNDSGDIIYSVFKELDYSTSLKTGVYANTGIGSAFKAMAKQNTSSISKLTDFAPYLPSYEASASFISSPIFDNDKQIGVLIFQMPIERINAIMTHNENWEKTGLGKSGETYLVGYDYTLRSESRFLLEDKEGYLKLMNDIGLPNDIVNELKNKGTSIGIQPVKTIGTKDALAGNQGFKIFDDYRGISVLSAYTNINLLGQNWALMSEIDESEAFQAINHLKTSMFSLISLVIGILAITAAGIGYIVAKIIITPINKTVDMVKDIAEGEGDLTKRLEDKGQDELDELSYWFNHFMEDLQRIISEFKSNSIVLASSSQKLTQTANRTGQNMQHQLQETEAVSTAITQMSSTVELVFENSKQTATTATLALKDVNNGDIIIQSSGNSMTKLAQEIEQAASVIAQLQEYAHNIGGVLDVIRGIAEQTNLLALNAAIEAARAGEQGRGFAVVADEVRTLASRTQESTEEINDMIHTLRKGTEDAVLVMKKSQETATEGVLRSNEASEIFNTISQQVNTINTMMSDIAKATEQQNSSAKAIVNNIFAINESVTNTSSEAMESVIASNELADIAKQLQSLIGRFKVS